MSVCTCCRTPRHKRLVDSLFPEDPQNSDPVSGDLDKLLYFSRSEPDRLDDVGGYLVFKLRRSLARDRRGHVCVCLKIMEKLLSELTSERRQLLAESFLDMIHELLHANQLYYHNLAANSFVVFSELEEDTPPYHRQYDFCIERFAAMCLVKKQNEQYLESRRSGLRALRGVVRNVGSEGADLWESDHLNMIIPAFLINMQDHAHDIDLDPNAEADRASLGGREHLGELGEVGLKELVTIATIVHANSVLESVLQHFDYSNVWLEDHSFAAETFITITNTMQPQVRYLVIQAILGHVDTKSGNERKLKGIILDVLSRCVGVAADESIGPSVLDVFRTLMKHLKRSVEDSGQSNEFHETIVRMVGEFAGVLPDFHNPDIMNLIFSYVPTEGDGTLISIDSKQQSYSAELTVLLVKCLLAVASSSKPAMLDTTLSETLMTSLSQLLDFTEPDLQLDVLLLWEMMIDHHGNKQKMQLNTTWESLGECNLVLGKTTSQFQYHSRKIMFPKLINLVGGVALRKRLEFGVNGLSDTCLLATEIQDIALTQSELSTVHCNLLHCYVSGLLHMVANISESDSIEGHITEVLEERRQNTPYLLPDNMIMKWEDPVNEEEVGVVYDNMCLFQMREKGLVQSTPEMMRNSSIFTRYHNWEAGHSFRSRSIDQDEEMDKTDITFEHFKRDSIADHIVSTDYNTNSVDSNDPISYEEMLLKISLKGSIIDDVSDVLKSASPRNTTQGVCRPTQQPADDIITPSFH